MKTVDDIFKDFGGTTSVARELEIGISTASEMRRRKSIPVRYWLALTKAAKARGVNNVTLENLAKIHTQERAAS